MDKNSPISATVAIAFASIMISGAVNEVFAQKQEVQYKNHLEEHRLGLFDFSVGMTEQELDKAIAVARFPIIQQHSNLRAISVTLQANGNPLDVDVILTSGRVVSVTISNAKNSPPVRWDLRLSKLYGRKERRVIEGNAFYCHSKNIKISVWEKYYRQEFVSYSYSDTGFNACEQAPLSRQFEAVAFAPADIIPTFFAPEIKLASSQTVAVPLFFNEPASTLPLQGRQENAKQRVRAAAEKYRQVTDKIIDSTGYFKERIELEELIEQFYSFEQQEPIATPGLLGRYNFLRGLIEAGFVSAPNQIIRSFISSTAASFTECAKLVKYRNCALLSEYFFEMGGEPLSPPTMANLINLSTQETPKLDVLIKNTIKEIREYVAARNSKIDLSREDQACLKDEFKSYLIDKNGACRSYGKQGCEEFDIKSEEHQARILVNRCRRNISLDWACKIPLVGWKRSPKTLASGKYIEILPLIECRAVRQLKGQQ